MKEKIEISNQVQGKWPFVTWVSWLVLICTFGKSARFPAGAFLEEAEKLTSASGPGKSSE